MWRPSCQQTKVSTTDVTITTLPQYFMYFYLCISRPTCQQTKVFTSAESITTRPQSFVFAAREIFEQPYFSFHSIAFYRRGSSLQVENLSVCLSVCLFVCLSVCLTWTWWTQRQMKIQRHRQRQTQSASKAQCMIYFIFYKSRGC